MAIVINSKLMHLPVQTVLLRKGVNAFSNESDLPKIIATCLYSFIVLVLSRHYSLMYLKITYLIDTFAVCLCWYNCSNNYVIQYTCTF